MIKLKSIKQILEENQSAYFNEYGDLDFKSWDYSINYKDFKHFGKEFKKLPFPNYEESWIEKPKPKIKEYGYIDETYEIRKFIKEVDFKWVKRAPEYDVLEDNQ